MITSVIQTSEAMYRKKKAIKISLICLNVDIFKCLKLNSFMAIDNINESQIKCELMTNKVNMDNITTIPSN